MTEQNTMQYLVIDVDIESWINRPAVTSRGEMYLIDGTKLIGKVRRTAGRYHPGTSSLFDSVLISPEDQQTRNYLEKYEKFWVGGDFFLKFNGIFGYVYADQDVDDDLMEKLEDLRIVDTLAFDLGICHPFFSNVEGFASYRKAQDRLRIHTKHKARRPRRSNKIKKVGMYDYISVDISGSSPGFREALFSQVEYVDDYTWYVNLDDSVSDRGDHFITIRTKEPSKTRSRVIELAKQHGDAVSVDSFFINNREVLFNSIKRLTEKYDQ